jgi:hypothetical protein
MLVFATTVLMVLSTQCMNPTQHTGNGSDVGNGMITGLIYRPDGKTAAIGAKVYLRKKQSLADTMGVLAKKSAAADTATTITDENGKFVIDSVDTGVYVIESSDLNNNLAFKDSVFITDPDTTITVPPDTLKPAGALKGVIRLSEGGDVRKVFVLAFGIDRFARVNEDGSFRFTMLAEGKYDLRMIASLDNYGVLDTVNIPVISADTTNLGTVNLPFTGIPSPKNVSITYDTLQQIVTLTWDKADTGLVGGYNVYRRNVDSNTVAARINISPIMDTIYRDSTGIQDQTYEYKVTALDKQGNEGKLGSGMSVKVVGAFELMRVIKLDSLSDDPFSFVVAPDSSIYVAFKGSTNSSGFIGVFDKTGHTILTIGNGKLRQLYDVAIDSKKNIYAADANNKRIMKFNSNGDSILSWTNGSVDTLIFGWGAQDPYRIQIDKNDKIFILYRGFKQIFSFDTNGIEMDSISANFSNYDEGNMVVGSDGTVYTKEMSTNRIFVIDNNLQTKNTTGFTANGDLRAVDQQKRFYFKDGELIKVYSNTGVLLSHWTPSIPYDRLFIFGNMIYVLGNNNSKEVRVFLIPF